MRKGFLLGLVQYLSTQVYIGIYLLISPSPHWYETCYLPFNFIILSAIVIISTCTAAKKFNLERRDIWFQMLTLSIAFLVYQIGWLYFLVFSFRRGFLFLEEFGVLPVFDALLTAAEYSLISLITLNILKPKNRDQKTDG